MNYEYDKIVIGSCLNAMMYAFNNSYPIFFTEPQKPFRFDYLEPDLDLLFLKIGSQTREINTFNEPVTVGIQKQVLWERLLFLLSIGSRAPLSNLAKSMRIEDDSLTCFNEYSKIAKITFNNCYYFGDNNIINHKQKKNVANEKFLCYDWIAFNRGGKHKIDFIETEDKFVHKIWFYPSDRICGKTQVKDACAVSILTTSQLSEFNYSETMARFKLIHEMESRGMKGKFNGYGPNGKPKYYKFRASNIYRKTSKYSLTPPPESKNFESPKHSEEDLLRSLKDSDLATNRFLKYL